MKRILGCAAALLVSLSSAPAFAVAEADLNGSNLVWNGTAACLNQLYVQSGGLVTQGFVNVLGNPTSTALFITKAAVAPCTVTTNFSFAADTGGAQAANKVYYVYAAEPVAGMLQWVITLTAPNQGGDPWQNLVYTPNGGMMTTTKNAIFVGSYITNGNSDIVPFVKDGDEVIFSPSVSTATQMDQDTGYQASATFMPGGGYPLVSPITFAAATTPIPETASALLVDFVLTNTSTVFMDARVLNPVLGAFYAGGTVCFTAPQYYLSVAEHATPTSFNHARIKTAINTGLTGTGGLANALNTIEVGACQGPLGGNLEVTAAYVGYVEVPHHLSF